MQVDTLLIQNAAHSECLCRQNIEKKKHGQSKGSTEESVMKEISYTVSKIQIEFQKSTLKCRNPLWNAETHFEIQKCTLKSGNPIWNPEIQSKNNQNTPQTSILASPNKK